MPINTLTISEDNKVGASDLLSIHNPLVFICDAFYAGQSPTFLYVDVYLDDVLNKTYRAIPFKDLAGNYRQFAFFADALIRQLFFDINTTLLDDFAQAADTLIFVENLTRNVNVVFRDPEEIASPVNVAFVACSAASQFGDVNGANLKDLFDNETKTYYCAQGGRCYVYFYNDDPNNVLSIGEPLETFYAIDSNNDVFTDFNGDRFTVN